MMVHEGGQYMDEDGSIVVGIDQNQRRGARGQTADHGKRNLSKKDPVSQSLNSVSISQNFQ